MADTLSQAARSENMRRIRGKNTRPEIAVRRALHAAGLRFRLHRRELPGCPDIVLPSRRICVFVHGCFWHGCSRCRSGRRRVASNVPYWSAKIARNKARDAQSVARLRKLGWKVLTIWECEARQPTKLK